MADPKEIVEKIATKLKGKKAKVKKLEMEPNGTKGTSLPGPLKKALEAEMGVNLSKLRVHTGGNAAEISKTLGAKAFTVGSDIFFGKPGDAKDPQTLAHEVWHVVQQANGRVPKAMPGKALTSK
jgi:hypothetical protein